MKQIWKLDLLLEFMRLRSSHDGDNAQAGADEGMYVDPKGGDLKQFEQFWPVRNVQRTAYLGLLGFLKRGVLACWRIDKGGAHGG
ncbi:MAG: hypothetical protein ACYCS8_10120 [Acidithiobacillus sp.]